MSLPRLVGMVHLHPLPGSPRFGGDIDAIIERAVSDARTLELAGFDAIMIENFGDAPFFSDSVPAVTVASMTRAIAAVGEAIDLPIGVNVLRNDGLSAIAIAAATGASMIRVNVLSSMMYTDQGPIVGRAAEIARARSHLAPDVQILADVFVKHASPPPGATIELAAIDAWERSGADGLVVSGTGTGSSVDLDDLRRVRAAVPDAPIAIGSGASISNIGALAELSDTVIVGSSIKPNQDTAMAVDADLASEFVEAARAAGFAVA